MSNLRVSQSLNAILPVSGLLRSASGAATVVPDEPVARRLIERGVRFVQLFNNGQIRDHHTAIVAGRSESTESFARNRS